MTRVAAVNETIWTQLFLANREALLEELDILLKDMGRVRELLAANDKDGLMECLREGRLAKEAIWMNENVPLPGFGKGDVWV